MRVKTDPFRVALAIDTVADRAADSIAEQLSLMGDGGTIGFVYVTDKLASEVSAIIQRLILRTGIKDWVGTVGFGVFAGRMAAYDKPAIAAMVGSWPVDRYQLFDCIPSEDWKLAPDGALATAVVHLDPRNRQSDSLLRSLSANSGAYLFGGLTASRGAQFDQIAGVITDGGASGLLLAPEIPVAIGITQGCSPIGPARTITAARDNLVIEIDGESPLHALLNDLSSAGISDLKALSNSLHAGLLVANSDTGDYLVRNLTGIDAERGVIEIGEQVENGQRILFCQRDRAAAEADLTRMAKQLRARVEQVRGAIYISCIARGPNLFESANAEIALLQEALGDVPLVGFYANGEIARDRIYGYTGVLALF
jgi:small ligand-binding sensory domain FIST